MDTLSHSMIQGREELSPDVLERLETMENAMKNIVESRQGKPATWSRADFQIGKFLGKGQFGAVYLARQKGTDFIVALKTMKKKELTSARCQRQVLREIEIQSRLRHTNILALYNYFWDDDTIYLILEFAAQGELFTILQKSPNGRFEDPRAARYIFQVAHALEYCHSKDVIHRDIKPENLLLDGRDMVKLADFGWSVHAPSNRRLTRCGTLDYLPPEMVDNKPYSNLVDHWCLGVLAYEFCCGRPPFEAADEPSTCRKIRDCKVLYPDHMHPAAVDLVKQLLVLDPSKRISFEQVRRHRWIVSNTEQQVDLNETGHYSD